MTQSPTTGRARRKSLPVLGSVPTQRADATRNRQAILGAAGQLVTEHGVEALSMESAAARAGVGIGTVYRHFGDRAGLAHALLDAGERQLQFAFLAGPPPLGPGAPPAARIRAFLHAFVDRLGVQAALLAVAESHTPTARFHNGAYDAHHAHLAMLLAQVRPDGDARYLADALLAPLAAGLYVHQRRHRTMAPARIKAGLDDLVRALES